LDPEFESSRRAFRKLVARLAARADEYIASHRDFFSWEHEWDRFMRRIAAKDNEYVANHPNFISWKDEFEKMSRRLGVRQGLDLLEEPALPA